MDSRASTANSRRSAAAAHESSAEGNTTSPQQVVEPSPPLTPLAHPVPREPPPPYPGTPCRVPYSSTISSSGWNHPDTYLSPFVPDHDFSSSDLGNNRLSGIIRIDDDSQESRRRRLVRSIATNPTLQCTVFVYRARRLPKKETDMNRT